MITSFRHNLTNLFDFRGRQTRAQFWPYAAVITALALAIVFYIVMPEVASSFARVQRFAAEHPELATVTRGPTSYSISIEGHHPELMPNFSRVFLGIAAVAAVGVLLLGGAVVRRLHDSGKTGFWALAPLIFLLIGASAMPTLFAQANPDLTLFFLLLINNGLYIASLAYLGLSLFSASTKGENRFGAQPD